MAPEVSTTCQECTSNAKVTHTVTEHAVAQEWIPDFLTYIKTDAFSRTDRPLTYKAAIEKYSLGVSIRRGGRMLNAVESILRSRGWPESACAGATAYVVNTSTGEPGEGWRDVWQIEPRDARSAARAYVREQALA